MAAEPRSMTTTDTEYVVLQRFQRPKTEGNVSSSSAVGLPLPGQAWWAEVKTVTALNAQAAVRKATEGEGTYCAIPSRSWKTMTRKIESVKKDVWS